MCPFLPITTSVRLLITKINQYRLKSASNLILNGHGFYLNSKLRNRRLLAVYYAVNWLGLFSFISFIALNPTLLHWLSFSIYVAVRVDSAEDLFIIYSNIVAFQRVLVFQSELEQHVLRLLHRQDISFHLPVSLVDLEGLEPPTSSLWGICSHHLSYRSEMPAFDSCQGVANPYTIIFFILRKREKQNFRF